VAPFITLNVNGTHHKIDVDPDGFTGGELNGVERNTGMKWREWLISLTDREVSSLAWSALAWIAVRRAGQFIPFDEFADSLKIMELINSVSPDDAAPVASAVAASRRKRTS
jgi:hypothetical protein